MAEALALRASYLREAAHLLAPSSPAAAAFLGTARDRLIDEADLEVSAKDSDALRREICRACGNLMIPGMSCQIVTKSKVQKAIKKDQNTPRSRADSEMIYTCLRCNRKTSLMLPSPTQQRLKPSKGSAAPKTSIEDGQSAKTDIEKLPKTANASSKQRQKARKGGLQAMLERNKAQNSAKGGLDLMDFAM